MEATTSQLLRSNSPSTSHSKKQASPVVAIAATSLIGALTFMIPPMYFPRIAADFNVSSSSLGMTTTTLLLVSTVVALITGPLADRHGNRPLLLAGTLAAAAYFLSFCFAPNRLWLFPAAALGGVAYAILPNLSAAAAGGFSQETARRRALGWNSASGALSVVLVSPILALVVNMTGWKSAFALSAALSLVVASLVRSRLRVAPTPPSGERFTAGYGSLLNHRQMRTLFASGILRAVGWFGMLTYLGVFLGDHLDAGAIAIAAIYAAGGLMFFTGSLLAPKAMKLMRPLRLFAFTQTAMALFVVLLFVASRSLAVALVVTTMLGLFGGFSLVSYATMLIEQTPTGRATTMSINGVLISAAATAGGAIGGAVLATASFTSLGITLSVPALFSVVILVWPMRASALDVNRTQSDPLAPAGRTQ